MPTRSEMVTTLIAQMSDLLAPISKSTTRPVPMGLRAVSRWYEGCRNKGKAQLRSALDRISERITLAFQTLSRPEAIRGSTIEKQKFTLYFNRIWRRECQSIPIDVRAVFHSSAWEPTVLATSHWPIPCVSCAPTPCAILRRPGRGRRLCHLRLRRRRSEDAEGLIAANNFLRSRGRRY